MKRYRAAWIAAAAFAAGVAALRWAPYPALRAFEERPASRCFYDRTGELLQITSVDGGIRREFTALDEIPAALRDLVVFSEDRRFFFHAGVDVPAVARAAFQNVRRGRRAGGASTITMQLARLARGAARRPPGRMAAFAAKAAETLDAARLEARLSKRAILEYYLNAVPFGFACEGVASGARAFFSRAPAELSPAQMFLLAVVPRRPALYNPLTRPDECAAAALALRNRFAAAPRLAARYPALAAVGADDLRRAAREARRAAYPFEMPHYIRYLNGLIPEGAARRGGAVRLAADLRLQRRAESLLSGAAERYRASRLRNGAALVIDNRTGEILCWAGGAFGNAEDSGQVDGALALNRPGSATKPFLYALAFESGVLPSDALADIPRQYGAAEPYVPRNFNNRFNGPVLARTALASSLNIPAVELLYRIGVRRYGETLRLAGFESVERSLDGAGLGLALGNAPVRLVELARAFSLFPNDGVLPNLRVTALRRERGGAEGGEGASLPGARGIEVEIDAGAVPGERGDWNGKPGFLRSKKRALMRKKGFFNAKPAQNDEAEAPFAGAPFADGVRRVFEADTARIICSMLSDRGARALAFGTGARFDTPFPAMFKTGTANQFQSIVALGATPRYTAAAWMGNVTGETVIGRTGSSAPAAIVRDLLVFLQHEEGEAFRAPEGWRLSPVCALSGGAPGPFCAAVTREWTRPGEGGAGGASRPPCGRHAESGPVYPAEYQAWFLARARTGGLDYASAPLELLSPRDGAVFFAGRDGRAEIPVEVTGGREDTLNVRYEGRERPVPRPFVFFLPAERGARRLVVRCGDEAREAAFRVE